MKLTAKLNDIVLVISGWVQSENRIKLPFNQNSELTKSEFTNYFAKVDHYVLLCVYMEMIEDKNSSEFPCIDFFSSNLRVGMPFIFCFMLMRNFN